LEKTGIAADLLRKVKNTYRMTINCIKTNKGQSAWFDTRSEVRQSKLSLILFNIIINNACNKRKEKIKVNDLKRFHLCR
jgi:hypothetical protein